MLVNLVDLNLQPLIASWNPTDCQIPAQSCFAGLHHAPAKHPHPQTSCRNACGVEALGLQQFDSYSKSGIVHPCLHPAGGPTKPVLYNPYNPYITPIIPIITPIYYSSFHFIFHYPNIPFSCLLHFEL